MYYEINGNTNYKLFLNIPLGRPRLSPPGPFVLVKGMAKKKAKVKAVTIRERKFIKGIMEGKTAAQAMREAGYAENTALYKSTEKFNKVKDTIVELMEKRGLNDDRLLEVLEQGLKATKVISATIIAKDGEGMKDADSFSKDFVDVDDYAVRHKYMETGLKLQGHLKDKLAITGADGGPVVTDVTVRFVKSERSNNT